MLTKHRNFYESTEISVLVPCRVGACTVQFCTGYALVPVWFLFRLSRQLKKLTFLLLSGDSVPGCSVAEKDDSDTTFYDSPVALFLAAL